MNRRDNLLKAIRFDRPDYIPVGFHINSACWHHYDQTALQDLMESHRFLFPDFVRQDVVRPKYGPMQRKDVPYKDEWGCVWETADDGITGSVHGHPLADWSAFETYRPPLPADFTPEFRESLAQRRARGLAVQGGLPHGHTFLRLQDIRGYENLLLDMADNDPRLMRLIDMVEAYNARLIDQWVRVKPDIIGYPEDLGMQVGPMLSPSDFRKYIKPVYQRLMKPARDLGCVVHMHSDGDIRTLVDDLIDGGVEVINLQDLVNGIDWIKARFAGRVCIDLDVDRQQITARGTPAQVDALIREEVTQLASRQGGLIMTYGLYPGVPLANVKSLMDAFEKYATYYS